MPSMSKEYFRARRHKAGAKVKAPTGKTERLEIRLSPEELEQVKEAAREEQKTVSHWCGETLTREAKMRMVTVPGIKTDPQGYGVQKYSNDEEWNTTGGIAPNGVSATRYLRKTSPDLNALSGLARWLAEHAPEYVAGKMSAMNPRHRVYCYNGRTVGEEIVHHAETERMVNGVRYNDQAKAVEMAQAVIKMYGSEMDKPQRFDWLFSVIKPQQSDEAYWNAEAEKILASGAVRVETMGEAWERTTKLPGVFVAPQGVTAEDLENPDFSKWEQGYEIKK